jgi:hypothetical protein
LRQFGWGGTLSDDVAGAGKVVLQSMDVTKLTRVTMMRGIIQEPLNHLLSSLTLPEPGIIIRGKKDA